MSEPSRLVGGFHPVREALRSGPDEVERVLVSERRGGGRRREIEELCGRHDIPVAEVTEEVLDRELGVAVHNGFAAEVREPEEAGGRGRTSELLVLLEDVQDPRNLGAILRVCEAAGVGKVFIRDRGSAPVSEVAVKTAAGATEWLSVERVTNTARTIEDLKRDGYWTYGAVVGAEPPWEHDLTGKVVLCLGGEADGLRHRTREVCDAHVGLPMLGRIGSLNVATAASALLYDIVRQRSRAAD